MYVKQGQKSHGCSLVQPSLLNEAGLKKYILES